MIALARRRLGGDARRVRFVQADVRDVALPDGRFDAVVSHFVLDLFGPTTLTTLTPRLAAALRPGGAWLLADFALPAGGPRRWRARAWLALLHALFRWRTDQEATRLHDPSPYLADAGLRRERERTLEWGLLRSEFWRLEEAPLACELDHELVRNREHFTPVN